MPGSLEVNLFYKFPSPKFESAHSILSRAQEKRALLYKTNSAADAMRSSTRSSSKKNISVSHNIKKRKIEAGGEQNEGKTAASKQKMCKLEHLGEENTDHLGPEESQGGAGLVTLEEPNKYNSSNSETSETGSTSPSSSCAIKTPHSSPFSLAVPCVDMSEYEMKMQENIQQRLHFLSSLNIEETKNEVLKLCPVSKSSATPKERGISKIKKKPSPRSPVPLRKSLRLSHKPQEMTPIYNPAPEVTDSELISRPESGGTLIDYLNEKLSKEEGTKMLEYTKGVTEETAFQSPNWTGALPEVLSGVRKLRLEEDTMAKAVPQRIMSMAFHPSLTDDVVFAGDKSGHLGVLHVDRKDEVDGAWCFRIHGAGINCLSVDTASSSRVITTSYDGSTRATDLQKLVVDDVLSLDPTYRRHYLTWHAHQTPHVLLVSCGDGTVTRVDMREKTIVTSSKLLDQKRSIKVVTVHPTAPHYFVSSSAKG
ncbi:WD40-repeat-containing domain [Trinorchestia longiramus]|nr:WD40-repeat-containing domain [Trinorchestia longiramus]